jgi:hypothetical protein
MPLLHKVLETNDELKSQANVFEIEYSNFNYIPYYLRNVNAFPYIVAYSRGKLIEEFNDQRTQPKIEAFLSRNSNMSSSSTSSNTRKKRILKKYSMMSKSN